MSIRVLKFGITNMPDRISEEAFKQIILRNKLWNALVINGQAFSDRYYEIINSANPFIKALSDEVAEIGNQIEELKLVVGKEKSKTKGSLKNKELKARMKELRALLKSKKEELKPLKTKAKELQSGKRIVTGKQIGRAHV